MLLTNSTAAFPTSSAEAIVHRVFRPRVFRFLLLLLLFNLIQHDDLSAAWPSFLTALLLCLPVTPSAENSRHTDGAGNPLQPISTGKFHIFQGVHHISPFFHCPTASFFPLNCQLDDYDLFHPC